MTQRMLLLVFCELAEKFDCLNAYAAKLHSSLRPVALNRRSEKSHRAIQGLPPSVDRLSIKLLHGRGTFQPPPNISVRVGSWTCLCFLVSWRCSRYILCLYSAHSLNTIHVPESSIGDTLKGSYVSVKRPVER